MNELKTEEIVEEGQSEAMAKLGGLTTSTKTLIHLSPEELKTDIKPNIKNRLILNDHNHIRRLRKSMREKGFVQEKAIIIGSDLTIKAGHYRYYAALEEGIGAWVQIDDNYDLKEHSQVDNIVKPWSSISWIRYYANEKKGDYPRIMEFIEKYGFDPHIGLMHPSPSNKPAK